MQAIFHRIMVVMGICILLMLVCCCAYADESVQVTIPAAATGADCVVELLDSQYQRVALLELKKDVPGAFRVQCNGLMRHSFKALVMNKDNEEVNYDRTVYTLHVDLFYAGEDDLTYFVTIEDPQNSSNKLAKMSFGNTSLLPVPTPTPTPAPTPGPTATPNPYVHGFTFIKQWVGDAEESIDWVFYTADGMPYQKKFNKNIVGQYEWQYEAYFAYDMGDCYVIETPPEGYMVRYENVGSYGNVTDRCHNGGTIINSRVPQTGDETPVMFWLMLMGAAVLGMGLIIGIHRRSKPSGK